MEKLVIYGWNNITGSLAEGIRQLYPECEILCPDALSSIQSQYLKERVLSPLPEGTSSIVRGADYILLGHQATENLEIIKSISSFVDENSLIMDFQTVKKDFFEQAVDLLKDKCFFASVFPFVDIINSEMVRNDLFQNKIIAVISQGYSELLQKVQCFWQYFKAIIVPTSADFYDEIFSVTSQGVFLLTNLYMKILQRDSWSDTLFFGFYNRHLRHLVEPIAQDSSTEALDIIANKDNILRMLSFVKREIDQISYIVSEDKVRQLAEYIETVRQFQERL